MQALELKMHNYDVHYGSIYDVALESEKIGMGYHSLHWMMLAWAGMITDHNDFFELALKWYEMDMQSEGTNIEVSGSIDPANHGSNKLNDGAYWYNYWSTHSPTVIIITHKTASHLNTKGINLFLVGDHGSGDWSIQVFAKDEHGRLKKLYPGSGATLHPVRKNATDGHITTVLPITFHNPLNAEYLEIKVDTREANSGIVAIREIGIWQDWSEEFRAQLNKLNIKAP